PQIIIISIETLGRLTPRAFDLYLFQFWRNCANYARSHFVLKFEDILQHVIETIRPEVGASRGVYELTRDAHAVRSLAHAALQHVTDAEFTSDLLNVY